jgi:tetratricopeptide (TPR) repeat protein
MVGALVVALRRVQRDPLGIAVLAGVTGYLAQAQFNFSLPGVEALMWLLLGVAASPHRRSVKLAIQPVVPTAIVGLMVAVPFVLNIAADAQLERGRQSEQSGNLVKAQELFQSASSLASWQPTLEEVVARFGMRIGDNDLAQSAAVVASSRSGEQLRWRELQGEALLASGEFADARDWYQSLIEESPHDSSLFVGLGRAQLGLADTGWALVAFNTALQINPNSEKAQMGLDQIPKP